MLEIITLSSVANLQCGFSYTQYSFIVVSCGITLSFISGVTYKSII